MEQQQADPADADAHWRATRRLALLVLILWALAAFGLQLLAPLLNGVRWMGFPLGFLVAAQGTLVSFVALLVWFTRAQQRIDRRLGGVEE